MEKASVFGDHPSQTGEVYLGSERPRKVVKNMPVFKALRKRPTFACNIFVEAYLAGQIKKITQSRFVLKSNVPSISWILWNFLAGVEGRHFSIIFLLDPKMHSIHLPSMIPSSLK